MYHQIDGKTSESTSSDVGQRPVLVVHDNRHTAALLRALLGARGHAVTVAAEGACALQAALTVRPIVILLSLAALHPDGAAVGWLLRADPRTASVPLIGLAPRQYLYLPSIRLAVNDMLWEPFTGENLACALARWIPITA